MFSFIGKRESAAIWPDLADRLGGNAMIGCVRVLHFGLRLHVLRHPEQDGEPLALVSAQGKRRRILDIGAEAAALPLWPGMALRDLQAIAPHVTVVETDPAREAAASQQLTIALEELSPLVEPDEQDRGCWYLDLAGLARLFGSPAELARRLLDAMPPLLRARVGIADTKFTARVAAGRAKPGSLLRIPPGETTSFLASEPIESLPASPEHLRLYRHLGIDTLGQLRALPGSAVAARFGPAGRTAWELAGGIDAAPVVGQTPRETIEEHLALEAPTASRDALFHALRLVLRRASRPLRRRGRGARQVLLRLTFDNGGSWEKTIVARDPAADDRLIVLVRQKLQDLQLPRPVTELMIELSGLSNEAGRQAPFGTLRGRDFRPIGEADRQLKARYPRSALYRAVPVEPWSRIPERQYALMPHDPGSADTPRPLNVPRPVDVELATGRPVAIIDRRRRRPVARIEDRWSVAQEWWGRPVKRRYYRVALADGSARTVYQDLANRRWYLQEYREEWP
jgi:DNA polymerase-4/protein ImuB